MRAAIRAVEDHPEAPLPAPTAAREALVAAMDPELGDDMLVPLGWVKTFVRDVLCDEGGAEALVVEARRA